MLQNRPNVYNHSPLAMPSPAFHDACKFMHQCVMRRPQADDRQAHRVDREHLNVDKVLSVLLGLKTDLLSLTHFSYFVCLNVQPWIISDLS